MHTEKNGTLPIVVVGLMIECAAEPKAHFKFNGIVGYFVIFYSIFAPSR